MNQKDQIMQGKATQAQRKAARKTAIILALVALGFFTWSVFIVMDHAKG